MLKNPSYKLRDIKNLDNKSLVKAGNEIEITKKKLNIFVCGNGRWHTIVNHYVFDYFKVLEKDTKLSTKIISLCSDNTLISNDSLIALSSSGIKY